MSSEPNQDPWALGLKELRTTLSRAENQFRRACDQIVLLNTKLRACGVRYQRAKKNDLKPFRYPLRLRLAVIEGARNMYYDFATLKAQEVEVLRRCYAEALEKLIVISSVDDA